MKMALLPFPNENGNTGSSVRGIYKEYIYISLTSLADTEITLNTENKFEDRSSLNQASCNLIAEDLTGLPLGCESTLS
jgi:hypothetical protein